MLGRIGSTGRWTAGILLGAGVALSLGSGAQAEEIKIGNTGPYSGPVASASTALKTMAAFFQMVNDQGGVNGRTIKFISVDDGYAPPKTVEVTRRLVEQDDVLFMLGSLGAPTQLAVQKYLNEKKVPQLFLLGSEEAFYDPAKSPYTIGSHPSYVVEAHLIGKFIAKTMPDAKVAVLFQNDDFGKAYLKGLKDTLPATQIVAETSYEVTDPTVDSQLNSLKASGADTLVAFATQRAGSQAIRSAYDSGWKPQIILPSILASPQIVFVPAGIEKAVGAISATIFKNVMNPQLANDPDVADYLAFMKKYNPDVHPANNLAIDGYYIGRLAVEMITRAGDNLSRENIMKQVTSLTDYQPPLVLPGIKANVSPTNYQILTKMQFQQFNGKGWTPLGELMSDE